jgi:hypothetical protein
MLKFYREQSDYRLCFTGRKGAGIVFRMLTVSPELQHNREKNYCNRQKWLKKGIGPCQSYIMTVISSEELIAWYKWLYR